MYRTRLVRIRKNSRFRDYCRAICLASAGLYNRANYLIRQYATACRDWNRMRPLTKNQMEVFRLVREVTRGTRYEPKGQWLTYGQLDYILKVTHDPAYYALPSQANQQILRKLLRDYKSFFEAMKVYRDHPGSLTGRPGLPAYRKKGAYVTAILTNQICKIRDGHYVRFPGTEDRIDLGRIPEGARLKEVRIKHAHDEFYVEAVLELDRGQMCKEGRLTGLDESALRKTLRQAGAGEYRAVSIDPGVDNFCAVTNNFGERPFLIKGNLIKAENQYYNKRLAELKSEAMRCNGRHSTRRIRRLTGRRNRILKDLMHKASRRIVDWAADQRADLVILGHNTFQKQEISLGHVSNQNFVQIPYSVFADMLRYKLEERGIALILAEESYTSKADCLAGDEIPVYGKKGKRRQKTGLSFPGKGSAAACTVILTGG